MHNLNNQNCNCCNKKASYNITVAVGTNGHSDSNDNKRFYLPNQGARKDSSILEEIWFCKDCMRFIEDNFRATINYLNKEKGTAWARKNKSLDK